MPLERALVLHKESGARKGQKGGKPIRTVRFRSFFPKCFSLYAIKALAFLLLIELLSAAQNLINFHYNFVHFMVPARFPISVLFGAWGGGNKFDARAIFVGGSHKHKYSFQLAFLFIIGLKDEGCRSQRRKRRQTYKYIYTYIYILYTLCVLLFLQGAPKKKRTTVGLPCLPHFHVCFWSTLFALIFFCLLQLRKIPICSKFCDFSFIRTYKTFLVSCWLFLFLPPADFFPQNAIIE